MPAPRLLLPLAALLLPTQLYAGEPSATSEFALEPLDTAAGAIPIDPPTGPALGIDHDDRPTEIGAKMMFINFDGQQMNACNNNNPQQNCSQIFGGTVLPFSGDAGHRAAIVQVVRSRVADFGVTVTDQRPPTGDYDMEMVGNWQNADPDFAGVAPSIDCFDNNGGEVSFTLEASPTADGIAEIVLQEIAHTWGLEHINDTSDLLYPTTEGSGKVFRDECIKIVSNTNLDPSNGFCNAMHTQFCNTGFQNSYRELLELFGESLPDTIAPTIEILSPEDGAELEGGDLDLIVDLLDDQLPAVINASVILTSDALPEPVVNTGAYASPGQLTFPISGCQAARIPCGSRLKTSPTTPVKTKCRSRCRAPQEARAVARRVARPPPRAPMGAPAASPAPKAHLAVRPKRGPRTAARVRTRATAAAVVDRPRAFLACSCGSGCSASSNADGWAWQSAPARVVA